MKLRCTTADSKLTKLQTFQDADARMIDGKGILILGGEKNTHSNDSGSCAHGTNVEHKNLILAQLGYLALLLTTLQTSIYWLKPEPGTKRS